MSSRPEPRKAEEADAAEQRRRELKARFARVSRDALGGRKRMRMPAATAGGQKRRSLSRMEIAIVIGIAVFVVMMAMRVY